jgi:hypothetical protein
MALLERPSAKRRNTSSRQEWRLPNAEALSERARAIGQALQSQEARVALAFDGYTVVGACWRTALDHSATHGPFVVPRQTEDDLGPRLLQLMEDTDCLSVEEHR